MCCVYKRCRCRCCGGDSNETRMNARLWGDWEWNDDDKKLFHLSRRHCSRRSSNSTMTKLSLLLSSLSYCMVSARPIVGGGKMNVNYVKEQHKSTSHWKAKKKSGSIIVLLCRPLPPANIQRICMHLWARQRMIFFFEKKLCSVHTCSQALMNLPLIWRYFMLFAGVNAKSHMNFK